MNFLKEHFLFVLIALLCAVFRFVPLFQYQFTLDELSGLDRTFFDSFSELIDKGIKIDAHPAFVQVLIYYFTKWFGYANWIVKLPFLFFSLAAIIYAYFFSLRNFSKQAAVFSAIIFSFSLVFVFYAPIARMYISGVFFSLALLYYFFEIFFLKQIKTLNYFFLGLFALLSAFNQHINALFAFTLCASGFLFVDKATLKNYLITCLLVIVLYLPHLPITLYQLSIGGIGYEQGGWLAKPSPYVIIDFLKILFGTGNSYLVLCALVIVSIALNKKIKFKQQHWLLLILFLLNFSVVYFYSFFRASIYQNSVMLFSSTGIVLIASSFLEFRNKYLFYFAAFLLASVLMYKTYLKKEYYTQCVKTVFEYQFERSIYYKNMYGDKRVYPIFFDADNTMKKIYFAKYHRAFDCKTTFDVELASMKNFSRFVNSLSCDYVVLSSAFPGQQAVVKESFPYLIENTQTQAVNLKVYSKRKSDSLKVVKEDSVLKFSNVFSRNNFNYLKTKKLELNKNTFSLKINSTEEFPFDAVAKYGDVVTHEGQVLLVKMRLKLQNMNSSALTSCIVVKDSEKDTAYTYTSKEASDFVIKSDSTVTLYADNFFGTSHQYIKNRSNIHCYVWNRQKENALMNDYDITLINFGNKKWQFWE